MFGHKRKRLEIARKLGVDKVFLENGAGNGLQMISDGGIKVDYIFEATGKHDIFKNGMPMLKDDGTLAIYRAFIKPYIVNEGNAQAHRQFTFTTAEAMAYDYVCGLLNEDNMLSDLLMTHKWDFYEIEGAFEQVRKGDVTKGIVVI